MLLVPRRIQEESNHGTQTTPRASQPHRGVWYIDKQILGQKRCESTGASSLEAAEPILARVCLFKINTGCREQEVCQLRWDWEVPVSELNTSVFIIPGEVVKNREDRLVVLNRIAWSLIDEARGTHPEFVFTYKGHAVQTINNTAGKRVRKAVGLAQVRVHDLKRMFGRRLRAAGVPVETR